MFFINLEKKIEVFEYTQKVQNEDKKTFGVKSVLELSDYDFKVFETEQKAKTYARRYVRTLRSLNNNSICQSRSLPNLLYKRRYIVQTLLGEKMQTIRHYNKKWPKGQLFNLYDQTFFLTVKLQSITEIGVELYRYDFKLINRGK